MKKTICLNMIVKNEKKNLRRLFKSLKNVIDYYVIHDTGSTDGTQGLIKEVMNSYDISGEIIEEGWVNFGVNRQKALECVVNSKFNADYLLWIDADEELYFNNIDWFNNLTKDCYNIKRVFGSIDYYNPHLIRINNNNSIGWYWKGPVHNYLSSKIHYSKEFVDKEIVHIKSYCSGGAKSQNVSEEEKYLKDAKLLIEYLKENPNDPRSIFYIAQSYKDADKYDEAIKWYKKRLTVEGWLQEKYISCYNIGNLLLKQNKKEEAFYYYYLSYEYDDSRYECFYKMINQYRLNNKRKLAYNLYKMLKPVKKNDNKLFFVFSIHEWKLDFEISIISFYVKKYQTGINAFKKLFKLRDLPFNFSRAILNNYKFYLNHIKKEEKDELTKLRNGFENYFFPNRKPQDIKLENIKEEVKEEINLSTENEVQGLKLTVTEKLN